MQAITLDQIRSYIPQAALFELSDSQKNTIQKVKAVAFPLIKELAMLAISVSAIIAFAAPSSIPVMLAVVGVSTIINLALRYYASKKAKSSLGKSVSENLRAFSFTMSHGMYLSTLAHEYGHVLACKELLNIKDIGVTLFADGSGVTNYRYEGLSSSGSYFGKEGTQGLISASGTLVEIVLAISFIITAVKIYKKHPNIAKHLLFQSLIMIIGAVGYAISSLSSDQNGHDFISVASNLNIHPIISAILIIGIPVITILAVAKHSKSFKKDVIDLTLAMNNHIDKVLAKF